MTKNSAQNRQDKIYKIVNDLREGENNLKELTKKELVESYCILYGFEPSTTIKSSKQNIIEELKKFVNNMVSTYEINKNNNSILELIQDKKAINGVIDRDTLLMDIMNELDI